MRTFNWLCSKYVQQQDARQKEMGLQYTTAETHDLAEQIDLVLDSVTKERDTLRDVLTLLAPDLKTMAILYKQLGDTARAQALMNICKSVEVV